MIELSVQTYGNTEAVDITELLKKKIAESKVKSGFALVQVPHTTAAIMLNEGHDKDVAADIQEKLSRLVPRNEQFYSHSEGNSDAHVKSAVIGASLNLLIDNGSIVLGTWQKVFLCEFDGPRRRRVLMKIFSAVESQPAR